MNLKAPKVPPNPDIVSYESIVVDEDQIFDGIEINDAQFNGNDLRRLISYNSIIKDSDLSDGEFDNADLTDTRFIDCDFSNTSFNGASMNRVEFINCKLVGISFNASILKNVKFYASLLNFAGINDSKLENVIFEESKLITSDFFDDKIKNVRFEDCDLTESRFVDTPLAGVDISSSYFETLSIKREDLEGCIVSRMQAIQMASLMGLVVKED